MASRLMFAMVSRCNRGRPGGILDPRVTGEMEQVRSGRGARLRALLARRRAWLWAPLVALLVTGGAVGQGLQADDHLLHVNLGDDPDWKPLHTAPWDAFHFFPLARSELPWAFDRGLAPWWADPAMHARFFRPLSSLTHWIDFRLWPGAPWLMHLQSLLWYALLCGLAAVLYRRLIGATWVAGFAALLFALDHNHGTPAGWIANRNALIAGALGLAALLCHHAWRRSRRRLAAAGAALLLGGALAGGETALSAAAYLLAYALFLERGSWPRRLATLLPYLPVGLAWAALWTGGDFGVRASSLYLDPTSAPGAFLRALPVHATLLGASDLGGIGPDTWMMLDAPMRAVMLASGAAVMALALVALHPLVRRDRTARFLAAGGALAILPACATFPSMRLLLVPSFGLIGAIAMATAAVVDRADWLPARRRWRWPVVAFAVLAGGGHLVLSPLLMQVTLRQIGIVDRVVGQMNDGLPDQPALAEQRVMLVTTPDPLFTMYLTAQRASRGQGLPGAVALLATADQPIELERVDPHTLVVRAGRGFFGDGSSVLTRPPGKPLPAGTRIEVDGLTLEVVDADGDGVPTALRVRTATPLDHPSLRWMSWNGNTLVPVVLPRPGERLVVTPHPFRPW